MDEGTIQNHVQNGTAAWTAAQTYTTAAVCLLIGVLAGYLLHGPAKPGQPMTINSPEGQPAASAAPAGMGQQGMPTLSEMKRMADKQAEPLLAKIQNDPKNVDALNKAALTYKSAHQFGQAIAYFQKALAIDPKNVPIRTDMASCMYYLGDVDGAIAELHKSLSYDPKHAGTLMNLGIIEWKGKNDGTDALAAWKTLLKVDPDFPQKAEVEHLIAEVQQQQAPATASLQPKD